MKKILLVASLLVVALGINAQINFDNLEMPKYKNGSSGVGGFTSGDAFFSNSHNAAFNSWDGFAVSKDDDTETQGYTNQFSAFIGEGANASENYLASFVSSFNPGSTFITLTTAQTLGSVKITNSTYATLSMQNGDASAKKFGGDSGNDEDWFLLTIKGANSSTAAESQIEFYLADFRFSDNTQDYIVDTWQSLDLSPLGEIDVLTFEMSSSDNHPTYGMNTPAYFCMDDFETATETLDFEEYDFDYWNGSDLSGGFDMNGGMGSDAYFQNNFTASASGGYWNGFSYSIKNDVLTEGYDNQYAAITGTDASGSGVYAVAYSAPGIKFENPTVALSMKLTNSTYAALSMQNGDAVAKQFGGATGEDQDWFLLSIEGYNNNSSVGTTEFYLADYRFSDNSQDYIVDTWETVQLTFNNSVDSIAFSLSSSDVGGWGMNTPAYFCMDELELTHVGIENIQASNFNVFPNPAKDFVVVESENSSELTISDLSGKMVYQSNTVNSRTRINLSGFESGVYILSLKDNYSVHSQKLVIE